MLALAAGRTSSDFEHEADNKVLNAMIRVRALRRGSEMNLYIVVCLGSKGLSSQTDFKVNHPEPGNLVAERDQ